MNMIPEDDLPDTLHARLAGLKSAVSALQPPPALEAELRARLFAAIPLPVAFLGTPTPHDRDPSVRPLLAVRPLPPAPARTARRTPGLAERWAAWIAWPVSVAAATGLCSWMVFTNPAVAPERMDTPIATLVQQPRETATPFLALAALDDIPAGTRGELVSAKLPRATLAEFGLPVSPLRAAESIQAEFLVGADGGVLAVRFVDDSSR